MDSLKSKKAVWWGVGVLVLLAGVFAAAAFLPHTGKPYGSDAPDIQVPSMKNIPNPDAHKLDLEVPAEEPKE
jgi:hypothetical protein